MLEPKTIHLDDCLSHRGDRLFIEECDSVEISQKFGTPLFVVSEDQLRRNIRSFTRAFQSHWKVGPIQILPAAKANWISAVLKILSHEGCGLDIYSSGELEAGLKAGIPPHLISANGVPKDSAHIRECVRKGVRLTIDSSEELDEIERAAAEFETQPLVRLRLKPPLHPFTSSSQFATEGLVPTDLVAIVYKGGLDFETALALGKRILRTKRVTLTGFHQHHGRHHPSTHYWRSQMKSFATEIGRLSKALGNFRPQEIDIGGGFSFTRDPFSRLTKHSDPIEYGLLHGLSYFLRIFGKSARYRVLAAVVSLFETHLKTKSAPSIEEYAAACCETLLSELPKHGLRTQGITLQIEPGRSLFGNTGVHLTTVRAVKRSTHPIPWNHIILDTSEFWFTGGRIEHHLHNSVFAGKMNAPLVEKADLVGRSCFGERLSPMIRVPKAEVGDLVAFLDTGAYQEVSASNFNAMPRPATVLVSGYHAEIIREAESLEDLFRRDRIPGRLK